MLKANGMKAGRVYYVGLDVHLRTSTCCILDDQGQQVKLHTIRGHWSRTIDFLQTLPGRLIIGFEASCAYGTVHDRLAAFCQRVVVAHPGHLRLIFASKRKNDRVDAAKLAKLLYLDELPAIHVPPPEVRAWRELIELRRWQIHQVTRVKNALRALMRTYGIQTPDDMAVLWTKQGRAWLETMDWPMPGAKLRCDVLLAQWDHFNQQIQRLTAQLDARAETHAGVALLCTIPGVGPRTAEAVIAYVDDPHRFHRINQVCAYAGLVPAENSSADAQRFGHITKTGPATLRWLLVEAAWQVIRREPSMRRYFEQIRGQDRHAGKKAIVAVARKLLRCMLAMLRSGEAWKPQTASDEAAKGKKQGVTLEACGASR